MTTGTVRTITRQDVQDAWHNITATATPIRVGAATNEVVWAGDDNWDATLTYTPTTTNAPVLTPTPTMNAEPITFRYPDPLFYRPFGGAQLWGNYAEDYGVRYSRGQSDKMELISRYRERMAAT